MPSVAVPVTLIFTVTGDWNCFVVVSVKSPSVASSPACVVEAMLISAVSSSVMVTVAVSLGLAAMLTSLLSAPVSDMITVSSASTTSSAVTSMVMVVVVLLDGKVTVIPRLA